MRLLMFQAKRFWWKSFSKTLAEVADVQAEDEVADAVVVFMHAEAKDAINREDVFRKTLKNVKWLANKRDLKRVVLHSFTHLGGENAEPEFAERIHRRAGGTTARHRLCGVGDTLRLLQRVGAERVRRKPREGVEGVVAATCDRVIDTPDGNSALVAPRRRLPTSGPRPRDFDNVGLEGEFDSLRAVVNSTLVAPRTGGQTPRRAVLFASGSTCTIETLIRAS